MYRVYARENPISSNPWEFPSFITMTKNEISSSTRHNRHHLSLVNPVALAEFLSVVRVLIQSVIVVVYWDEPIEEIESLLHGYTCFVWSTVSLSLCFAEVLNRPSAIPRWRQTRLYPWWGWSAGRVSSLFVSRRAMRTEVRPTDSS